MTNDGGIRKRFCGGSAGRSCTELPERVKIKEKTVRKEEKG